MRFGRQRLHVTLRLSPGPGFDHLCVRHCSRLSTYGKDGSRPQECSSLNSRMRGEAHNASAREEDAANFAPGAMQLSLDGLLDLYEC